LGLPVRGNIEAGKGEKVDKNDNNSEKWYSHQLSTDELKQFVEEAKKGKDNNKALIGTVTREIAGKIKDLCGKDVKAIILESSSVRHAHSKKNHNLEDDDLLHIVSVINNPTDIELSDKSHQDNVVLTFKKDINGEIDFVEEVRAKHNGQLALVTCYRPKKAGRDLTHTQSAPEA
jgi:hypothetical protein